jgi:hypothetical protein
MINKNYTVFTSPGDELAGSWKLRKRKSVNLNDNDNIAWQTPKIASTPQTTQISRLGNVGTKSSVKRQNQLFKSLFTIESPMNISNISLSSPIFPVHVLLFLPILLVLAITLSALVFSLKECAASLKIVF